MVEDSYQDSGEALEEESSPLVQSLREHFAKHYGSEAAKQARPFSSRNEVIKPLNLDFVPAIDILEMNK